MWQAAPLAISMPSIFQVGVGSCRERLCGRPGWAQLAVECPIDAASSAGGEGSTAPMQSGGASAVGAAGLQDDAHSEEIPGDS
jgi:hypothetical protein